MKHLVERYLACPLCNHPLRTDSPEVRCASTDCTFAGSIGEDVFLTESKPNRSYFDDKHESMQHGNESEATHELFYARQSRFAESFFQPGKVILDVGCGPAFSYSKKPGCFYIGLDYSLESIKANEAADLRIYGSAAALPLPDRSIDIVICFYSVHHMVGGKLEDNRKIVNQAFQEFARVVKPGGNVVVFEVSPWWPFGVAERIVWNKVKGRLGSKLDMYFWPRNALEKLGRTHLGAASYSRKMFSVPPLFPVYPMIALPKLKIPRCLYPFDVCAYRWELA